LFSDIKVKEPNLDAMMRGKVVYESPRFMSVAQASEQLLEILDNNKNSSSSLTKDDLVVGVARLGSTSQNILACSLLQMSQSELGPPLHSLIIPGKMHPLEEEFLEEFKNDNNKSKHDDS
jgi:diphthine synthase